MQRHDVRFRVMGSVAHLVLAGQGDLATAAQRIAATVAAMERSWSRFLPDSDLSRLNAAAGTDEPVEVPPLLTTLIELAIEAWRRTDGRFDPTILDALVAAGYDRTAEEVVGQELTARPWGEPTPGCVGIELDRQASTVRLPEGVHLDLGGLGKGFAGRIIVQQVVQGALDGVTGALVSLGGDVQCGGDPPNGAGWVVGVEDPGVPGREVARVALKAGAVATSTLARRRWTVGGEPAHHLIEPSTGRPAEGELVTATVVGADLAWAEVLAKTILLGGWEDGVARLQASGATGLAIDARGNVRYAPGFERFVPPLPSGPAPAPPDPA